MSDLTILGSHRNSLQHIVAFASLLVLNFICVSTELIGKKGSGFQFVAQT